jgi:hypothetical protein
MPVAYSNGISYYYGYAGFMRGANAEFKPDAKV